MAKSRAQALLRQPSSRAPPIPLSSRSSKRRRSDGSDFATRAVARWPLPACSRAAAPRSVAATSALDQVARRAPSLCRESRARSYRHPGETLQLLRLRPDMTVVEVWPGGGWYTEILAPLLHDRGQLYAAHLDPASSEYAQQRPSTTSATKLAARPDLYDKVDRHHAGRAAGEERDRAAGLGRPGRDLPQPAQLDDVRLAARGLRRRCTRRSSPAACSASSSIAAIRGDRRIRRPLRATCNEAVRDRADRKRRLQAGRALRDQRQSQGHARTTKKACGRCRRASRPATRIARATPRSVRAIASR